MRRPIATGAAVMTGLMTAISRKDTLSSRRTARGRHQRTWALALAAALVSLMAWPTYAYQRPGTTERVSVASDGRQQNAGGSPGSGSSVSMTPNGRYVAFSSTASNLVPGDTNDAEDVFVHDRLTGTTERVSVGPGGAQ